MQQQRPETMTAKHHMTMLVSGKKEPTLLAMPEDNYVRSALQASEIARNVNQQSSKAESAEGGYGY